MGGPAADTGLTGRKIIVDTYGGHGSHGGGAFSGKDPSKVDRSASYMARHIAKNIVAAGIGDAAEVQFGYAIGIAEPVSVMVETAGKSKVDNGKLERIVRDLFPLTPRASSGTWTFCVPSTGKPPATATSAAAVRALPGKRPIAPTRYARQRRYSHRMSPIA